MGLHVDTSAGGIVFTRDPRGRIIRRPSIHPSISCSTRTLCIHSVSQGAAAAAAWSVVRGPCGMAGRPSHKSSTDVASSSKEATERGGGGGGVDGDDDGIDRLGGGRRPARSPKLRHSDQVLDERRRQRIQQQQQQQQLT